MSLRTDITTHILLVVVVIQTFSIFILCFFTPENLNYELCASVSLYQTSSFTATH